MPPSIWLSIIFTSKVYEWCIISPKKYMNGVSFHQKVYELVKFEKLYMNRYNFRFGKYMNESVFKLRRVYEWGGVRGLQPHVRTQIHGKLLPPPPPRVLNTSNNEKRIWSSSLIHEITKVIKLFTSDSVKNKTRGRRWHPQYFHHPVNGLFHDLFNCLFSFLFNGLFNGLLHCLFNGHFNDLSLLSSIASVSLILYM